MLGRGMLCQTTGMLLTVNNTELEENHKLVCTQDISIYKVTQSGNNLPRKEKEKEVRISY